MPQKDDFLTKVITFSDAHQLLEHQGKYLVALSGGADSVALLIAMHELGFNVEGIHCNFHLRGEESDRDENFCQSLCERLGIRLHIAHFATKEYAESHKISIEMAARFLRYDYFEKLRKDVGAADIAVAHHRDDSVETVILNLIRGTGIHGLTGIVPRRGHIVRPLLAVGREEIEAFLASRQQPYITDSSNLTDDVMRNKIRHHIVPAMLEASPSATDAILLTVHRLSEVAEIFDQTMADKVEKATLKCDMPERKCYSSDKIQDEHTLFYILYPLGFSPSQIQDIFAQFGHLRPGAIFRSVTHELLIDRAQLIIQPLRDHRVFKKFPIEGKYIINEKCAMRIKIVNNDSHFSLRKEQFSACLDASKVTFPLYLRNFNPGDRFHPYGMQGSKLVSDFLTDLKINLFDKLHQWILTGADDRIVWVVGHRIDHQCRITDTTQKVVVVELIQQDKQLSP